MSSFLIDTSERKTKADNSTSRAQRLLLIPEEHFKKLVYQSSLRTDMTKEGQFLSSVAVLAVLEALGQCPLSSQLPLCQLNKVVLYLLITRGWERVFCRQCDSRVRAQASIFTGWASAAGFPRSSHLFLSACMCVCVFRKIPATLPPCNLRPGRVDGSRWKPSGSFSLRPGPLRVLSGLGEQTPVQLRAGAKPRGKFGIIPSYASKPIPVYLFFS